MSCAWNRAWHCRRRGHADILKPVTHASCLGNSSAGACFSIGALCHDGIRDLHSSIDSGQPDPARGRVACYHHCASKLRWPPVWIPLTLFLGWLLVSLAASPEPNLGFPQVKKLYVFTLLPVALAVLPRTRDYLYVFGGWMAVASASCLLAVGQFGWKFLVARETSANFYEVYVAERITGFMSHWMTFSGQAMMVALVLTSYLLFGPILRPVWRAVC